MVNRKFVADRIAEIRRATKRLQAIRTLTEADFLANMDNYAIGEHYLRRAIEAMLDIGRHIIAKQGLGKPNEYANIGTLLQQGGVIPADLAAMVERLARYRNRLVHLYWQVTAKEIYQMVASDLAYLERFCHDITRYMNQLPPNPTTTGSML